MKHLLLSLVIPGLAAAVFSINLQASPQENARTFQYEDSVFTIGSWKRLEIVYDYDKAAIRPESYKVMDSVYFFLQCHPNFIVQISSHTDSRGNDKYNSKLSERRAMSVTEYLVHKGIDRSRITSYGAGETELIYSDEYIKKNSKDKKEQELFHQKNRRTLLKITGMDYKSQAGSEIKVTGTYLSPDVTTIQLLVGETAGIGSLSDFRKALLNESLKEYLKANKPDFSDNKKVFLAYKNDSCSLKILVFISKDLFNEPVLFSDEKNYITLVYDDCAKGWTEIN